MAKCYDSIVGLLLSSGANALMSALKVTFYTGMMARVDQYSVILGDGLFLIG
jgi:hypothetical protein